MSVKGVRVGWVVTVGAILFLGGLLVYSFLHRSTNPPNKELSIPGRVVEPPQGHGETLDPKKPQPGAAGPSTGQEQSQSPLEALFESHYSRILKSVEEEGELALVSRDKRFVDFMKQNPSAEPWLLSKLRTLGSLDDPVAGRLLGGLLAVDQDKARELVKSMQNRFHTPENPIDATKLLVIATGSGTRGERAEALITLLDSPLGRTPDIWNQVKALATSARDPWVRSEIMAHIYLSVDLSCRDFCQSMVNSYQVDERLGVREVRAVLFGKFLKETNEGGETSDKQISDRIEQLLFSELGGSGPKGQDWDKASVWWFHALRYRNALSDRDVISLVRPILEGQYTEDAKALAIEILAPDTLDKLDTARRTTKEFQIYRDSTISYIGSVYAGNPPAAIKESIISVYGKLGEGYHVDQLTRWKEKDPTSAKLIEAAIEEIQSRH